MVKATAFQLKGKAGYTTVAVKMLKGTCPGSMHRWLWSHPDNQGVAASLGPSKEHTPPPLLFLSGCILEMPPCTITDNKGQGSPWRNRARELFITGKVLEWCCFCTNVG